MVLACPDCDSSQLTYRPSHRSDPERYGWICTDCGHECDSPIERPPRSDATQPTGEGVGSGRRGLAGVLANLPSETMDSDSGEDNDDAK